MPPKKDVDLSKLKAFSDDISDVAQVIKFLFLRVENIVVKGDSAVYQQFLLFPQYFYKPLSSVSFQERG